MESLDARAAGQLLQRGNACCEGFFARSSGRAVEGSDEELAGFAELRAALSAVGLAFNEIVGQSDAPELARQLERYRVNLLQLGRELAAMQASALLCRQELVARTRHLRGTQAWLSASQETY